MRIQSGFALLIPVLAGCSVTGPVDPVAKAPIAFAVGSVTSVRELPDRFLVTVKHPTADFGGLADPATFPVGAVKGRAWPAFGVIEVARLDSAGRSRLRADSRVRAVEAVDQLTVTDQQSLTHSSLWGLDVLDQHSLTTNNLFNYYFTGGQGIHIYFVDSGIDCGHNEFASGVNCYGASFLADGSWPGPWTDGVNHGTRMASIAAGQTTGIARTATLHSVKVLRSC